MVNPSPPMLQPSRSLPSRSHTTPGPRPSSPAPRTHLLQQLHVFAVHVGAVVLEGADEGVEARLHAAHCNGRGGGGGARGRGAMRIEALRCATHQACHSPREGGSTAPAAARDSHPTSWCPRCRSGRPRRPGRWMTVAPTPAVAAAATAAASVGGGGGNISKQEAETRHPSSPSLQRQACELPHVHPGSQRAPGCCGDRPRRAACGSRHSGAGPGRGGGAWRGWAGCSACRAGRCQACRRRPAARRGC